MTWELSPVGEVGSVVRCGHELTQLSAFTPCRAFDTCLLSFVILGADFEAVWEIVADVTTILSGTLLSNVRYQRNITLTR